MLALVAFGIATAALRRATLFQIIGIVLVEHALALAALQLPGGASVAIELGVALDLMLVALVAVVFYERIFVEFGTADSAALRALRDSAASSWRWPCALPGLAAVIFLLAPTSLVTTFARLASVATATLALTQSILALRASNEPVIGDWLVVDVAGGFLVGVIGLVGLASILVSPAYLGRSGDSLVSPSAGRGSSTPRSTSSGRSCWHALVGESRRSRLSSRGRPPPPHCSSASAASSRARGGLEYLVLTSLGLGVALLGIVMLARASPTGGLGGLVLARFSTYSGGSETALIAYLFLLAGLAARIGWAPVHDWLPDATGGTAAGLRASSPPRPATVLSSRGAPSMHSHRLSAAHDADPPDRLRPRFARRRGAVSAGASLPRKRLLAYSSLSTWRDRARDRFGTPLGANWRRHSHRRPRRRQGTRLRRGDASPAHQPRAAGHAVTGIGRTKHALGGLDGDLALPRSPADRPRHSSSARCSDRRWRRLPRRDTPGPRARLPSCSRSTSSASPMP